MMTTRLSVIVPNYNHSAFLKERLNSIINQSYGNFECLILDDCSTDNSREIIDGYLRIDSRLRSIYNDENSGSTFAQWNKGVAHTNGEFVWIAESDDVADPDLLKELINVLETDPEIALAYCQSYRYTEGSEVKGTWNTDTDELDADLFCRDFLIDGKEFISRFLIHRNTIPNASAVVFRRSVYEKAGGAEKHLKTNSDWLTWLKMSFFGKIAFVSRPLNYFRYHSKSVIARAHQAIQKDVYLEEFDGKMREELMLFVGKQNIHLQKKIKSANLSYIALEERKKGLFHIGNRRYILGWFYTLKASFYPKVQLGFIKSALSSR